MRDEVTMVKERKTVENTVKLAPSPNSLARARAFATNNLRVDWFRILVHLKAEGFSMYAVSHFTRIPRSNLTNYKQGTQPSYHHGLCLLQFWAEATGNDADDAPKISPYSFKA